MTAIADYLNEAELALAAYAALPLDSSGSDIERALRLAGMSTAQATRFANTYTVATQYNAGNGLSATVFTDAGGNKYLAIRGTDDGYDLATDAFNIGLLGSTSLQPQYASLKAKVTEWLGNGTLSSSFTVTGHSLGGFLATGIAADFAGNVSHAYLYNSLGLGAQIAQPIPAAIDWHFSLDAAANDSCRRFVA